MILMSVRFALVAFHFWIHMRIIWHNWTRKTKQQCCVATWSNGKIDFQGIWSIISKTKQQQHLFMVDISLFYFEFRTSLPSVELVSSCGYDSLADVVISSSMSPIMVWASDDVVLGTDLARGGFSRFPSATNSFCGGFITPHQYSQTSVLIYVRLLNLGDIFDCAQF